MPNRDGTGPGHKRNSDRKRCIGTVRMNERRQKQSCRQLTGTGPQVDTNEKRLRFINTIKFVTFGFFTVLLPSAIRFGKLLISERRESVPQLEYKNDHKPKVKQEQINQ